MQADDQLRDVDTGREFLFLKRLRDEVIDRRLHHFQVVRPPSIILPPAFRGGFIRRPGALRSQQDHRSVGLLP